MNNEAHQHWNNSLTGQSEGLSSTEDLFSTRRKAGVDSFQKNGFPGRRHEEWRYTSLKSLSEEGYPACLPHEGNLPEVDELITSSDIRIVLINGVFRKDLSDLTALPDEVRVEGFSDFRQRANTQEIENFDRMLPLSDHPFQSLGDALLDDGLVVTAIGNTDARIHILHAYDGTDTSGSAHITGMIHLEGGARLEILEEFRSQGQVMGNTRWGIHVGDECTLSRQRILRPGCDVVFHGSRVEVGKAGLFQDLIAGSGSRLVRNEIHVSLNGAGGHTDLFGGYVSDGDEVVDHHTTIEHAVADCTSREIYRGVLGGKSRGAFTGMIHVHQDAQRTDAKQSNDAILLSRNSEMNTRPRLEIYADDVKCTHGATVGELDEGALFYLRSRGVSLEEARRMMVRAFTAEVFGEIENEGLREQIIEQLQAAMPASECVT